MYFPLVVPVLAAGLANAHVIFSNIIVDGADQGYGVGLRVRHDQAQVTAPLPDVTGDDMACGVDGEMGAKGVVKVKGGSKVTLLVRANPGGKDRKVIDPSHLGPCAVYMKAVQDASSNSNAAGPGWFKLMERTYDQSRGKWCTEDLIDNGGKLEATIPENIKPGDYLIRPEILALHAANGNPPDPQFYVACAQVSVSSSGDMVPKDTVSIPKGYVTLNTPGLRFNLYERPLKLPYQTFGPAPITPDSMGYSNATTTEEYGNYDGDGDDDDDDEEYEDDDDDEDDDEDCIEEL